jgi:hypothetical protein
MSRALVLFFGFFAGTLASRAGVVFADDFSYGDGTVLSGQTPDVGSGTWTGGSGWQVNGGALALAGGYDIVFGYFTSTLSAGQTLTVTFDTLAITGFLGSSWAVVSLFDNLGVERCFLGDPGGSNTTWAIGGNIANVTTIDSNQANTATFTYVYDTGAWTFGTKGGTYSGPGPAGYAIDHIRIASGGTSDTPAGNIKLDGITVSIEPEVAPNLKITGFNRLNATTYRLAWSGGDGTNDVEWSTDLSKWGPLLHNVASPQDITVDADAAPKQFFRVVEPAAH